KFKISKSRTSIDFIDHLRSIRNYIKKNKIKRFILVTDNASFHVSRKTKQFIENQLHCLTVIFLPKRSPNLNPVETRVNRNLKKDVCANHNYGTELNLTNGVRRDLRYIGSWPRL
ncbi:MAG: transposase, partial [Candidatus Nitrosopolaris sp.]